ncbi:hypothetical protein [Helicobacter pylori]|uniref:hypothetical protein n=1 Tax=Helicobacter pylori TaxID=210 RepID=UPI0012B4044C|nr:hypothetical protein [Helicobacter pylori]MCQ2758111.1 hypothetical protein [Helicobacter pylori]GHR32553.1 hypothetical protein JP0095_15400 [Helicobacter pylori]
MRIFKNFNIELIDILEKVKPPYTTSHQQQEALEQELQWFSKDCDVPIKATWQNNRD